MKRTALIISSGLLAAFLAQSLWFALRAPPSPSNNPNDLSWLKSELDLNEAQYTRICEIHQNSTPRIAALATQVARMKSELEAFERTRRTTGEIDFLEFARFVDMRRAVDRECIDSTRHLVQASAESMTPDQRARYLAMIAPIINQAPVSN